MSPGGLAMTPEAGGAEGDTDSRAGAVTGGRRATKAKWFRFALDAFVTEVGTLELRGDEAAGHRAEVELLEFNVLE